jgi:uncharacterized protein YukE
MVQLRVDHAELDALSRAARSAQHRVCEARARFEARAARVGEATGHADANTEYGRAYTATVRALDSLVEGFGSIAAAIGRAAESYASSDSRNAQRLDALRGKGDGGS